MQEFKDCIDVCGLLDINFSCSRFSWCNGQGGQARSWAHLDRAFFTSNALLFWTDIHLNYLPRTSSDHAPMMLQPSKSQLYGMSSFKFQQMWIEHESFFDLIKKGWEVELGTRDFFTLLEN